MDKSPSPEKQALLAAQEALRTGRLLIQALTTTLVGVSQEAPTGNRILEVLAEMRAAQGQASNALLRKGS